MVELFILTDSGSESLVEFWTTLLYLWKINRGPNMEKTPLSKKKQQLFVFVEIENPLVCRFFSLEYCNQKYFITVRNC